MDREELLADLSESLKSFFLSFINNPMQYFNEEDARSTLFYQLYQMASKNELSVTLPQNDWTQHFDSPIKVNPFKAEYPEDDKDKSYRANYHASKFDIAYIETEYDVQNHYRLPCSIAIELKQVFYNGFYGRGLIRDFMKLQAYQPKCPDLLGISILLDQYPYDENRILNIKERYKLKGIPFEEILLNDIVLTDNRIYAFHIFSNPDNKIFRCCVEKIGMKN